MDLKDLIEGQPSIEIKNIMYDSREKLESSLFACINGLTNDAHEFVNEAIDNGAIVIVHSEELDSYREEIKYIKVDNVFDVFPDIVNRFYDFPSQKMWVVGVTGTNGKTTVSTLIHEFMNQFKPTGLLGSIKIDYADKTVQSRYTTNDLVNNQKILNEMVDNDIEAVSMEISSQGIEQRRVNGIDFDVAVFTNLTQEHLDFHLSMENYYQAKKKLFTSLEFGKKAIINIDDQYGERLASELVLPVITVGTSESATYQIQNIKLSTRGTTFKLIFQENQYEVETNLLGRFNVINLVQAIAVVHESGVELESLIELAKNITKIEGRMEAIKKGQPFNVIVDFAHTPDGFEKIMSFVRSVSDKENRLIVVFGSPGKRDKSKRSLFGEMVEKYCDLAILTEDDNRDELVLDICHEIARGIKTKPYIIVENRVEAIRQALTLAQKEDTVLLLAKGNETFIAREFENEPYLGDKVVAETILDEIRKELLTDEKH